MFFRKFFISCVIICGLFVTFGLLSCQGQMTTKKAPDFTLKNIDGRNYSLSSANGKVIILDFWATWCPPCRKEIPHFVELASKYKRQGLEIIGISLDREGVGVVKSFAENNGINYPILMGNEQVVAKYGGIRGIPTTFVIDRKGQIVEKAVGYRDKTFFESIIKKYL